MVKMPRRFGFLDMQKKQKLLGLLIFASLLIALLGIGLSTVEMLPAEVFTPPVTNRPLLDTEITPGEISWFFLIVRELLLIFLIAFPIYILVNLFSKEGRKRLLKDLLRLVPTILILMWLFNRELPFNLGFGDSTNEESGYTSIPDFSSGRAITPIFEAAPKPWMLLVIIIGAAALIAGTTFFILRLLSERDPGNEPEFEIFAETAQSALDDIQRDEIAFHDVVIRCYIEMSQTLRAEDGIQRAEAMTTHEFGRVLQAKGFPSQPIWQLTQLFEQVRYGHQQPDENEKQTAIESLRDIIAFCRGQA